MPVKRRGAVTYDGLGEGVTFLTPPLRETEITGPIAAKLYVSSQTADADLFVIVRVLTPNMREVVFQGALDPHTPIAQGWLRASHRKLDPKLTLPYRPVPHPRREAAPDAGQALRARRRGLADLDRGAGELPDRPHRARARLRVSGGAVDRSRNAGRGLHRRRSIPAQRSARPAAQIFGKKVTIHCGPARASYVLLPIIPS